MKAISLHEMICLILSEELSSFNYTILSCLILSCCGKVENSDKAPLRTVSRTMTSSAEAETSSDPLPVLALLLESESLLSSCSFGIVDRKERLDQITSG